MPQTKAGETKVYLYDIMYGPGFLHEFFGVSQDIIAKIDTFYPRLEEDPAGCIAELTDLGRQYPHRPQFKNLLGVAYERSGNAVKATEINDLILSEHPDYIFAKINKAYEYLSLKQPEKVVELLGEGMQLKELYPKRDTFHIAELMAFCKLAFHYYLAIGKFGVAKSQLQVMETFDADHADAIAVRQRIVVEEANNRSKERFMLIKSKKEKKPPFFMRPSK